jgi:hypothetical protein
VFGNDFNKKGTSCVVGRSGDAPLDGSEEMSRVLVEILDRQMKKTMVNEKVVGKNGSGEKSCSFPFFSPVALGTNELLNGGAKNGVNGTGEKEDLKEDQSDEEKAVVEKKKVRREEKDEKDENISAENVMNSVGRNVLSVEVNMDRCVVRFTDKRWMYALLDYVYNTGVEREGDKNGACLNRIEMVDGSLRTGVLVINGEVYGVDSVERETMDGNINSDGDANKVGKKEGFQKAEVEDHSSSSSSLSQLKNESVKINHNQKLSPVIQNVNVSGCPVWPVKGGNIYTSSNPLSMTTNLYSYQSLSSSSLSSSNNASTNNTHNPHVPHMPHPQVPSAAVVRGVHGLEMNNSLSYPFEQGFQNNNKKRNHHHRH